MYIEESRVCKLSGAPVRVDRCGWELCRGSARVISALVEGGRGGAETGALFLHFYYVTMLISCFFFDCFEFRIFRQSWTKVLGHL